MGYHDFHLTLFFNSERLGQPQQKYQKSFKAQVLTTLFWRAQIFTEPVLTFDFNSPKLDQPLWGRCAGWGPKLLGCSQIIPTEVVQCDQIYTNRKIAHYHYQYHVNRIRKYRFKIQNNST